MSEQCGFCIDVNGQNKPVKRGGLIYRQDCLAVRICPVS